ncbi:glycosyltransferase [Leptolyngbyaceae cyanobacterium JSC-12]|nr:glycosyltransferase [Leptolyngbyaceae cyanobacterium JSC-12]
MIETAVKSASILCVGNRWFPTAPGGAERYIYELIRYLTTTGDRVELCATDVPRFDAHSSLLLTNLASAERSLPQRLWTSQFQFQRRSLTTPDAINLHFALYSFPILNQLPSNVPITFNFHGPWALESQQEGESKVAVWLKYWLEQQVFRRCDRFIVLSQAFGKILHQHYNISWDNIHVIPGGVDIQRFQLDLTRQHAREILRFPQDRPILFTPRRLTHRMGIDKLLQAVAIVKQQVPDVWLAIAGKGTLRPRLEQQVEDLGLRKHVKFLGYVPDEQLPIAYQAADLTVVPSQSLEGFGLILLESLACGTPVLSTPVGGMPEVLTPFHPALVIETPEAEAIAARLLDCLTGNLSLPSREACREYVIHHYDWKIVAPKVRDVLLMPASYACAV